MQNWEVLWRERRVISIATADLISHTDIYIERAMPTAAATMEDEERVRFAAAWLSNATREGGGHEQTRPSPCSLAPPARN